MESISFISSKKELISFSILLSIIFTFNVIYQYNNYKKLKSEEIYSSKFLIENIYDKRSFNVLKLKNNDFTFYTSVEKNKKISKLQNINIGFLTLNIRFLDYLKGFYAKSIFIDTITTKNTLKTKIYKNINKSHKDATIKEFFNALFLAIPVSKNLREIFSNYAISHLIAISGFHLGLISFIVYILLYLPYSYFHSKFFPYRNRKFDIVLLTCIFLFSYLIFLDLIPSLFRAFVMSILAIYFLRSNIKLISYGNLLLTFVLIISFFPAYLFSLSFWFSIIAVFYIFLYVQYFKNIPKIISILFFNFWIFLAFNPIVHYFFYNTAYEQLLSPILTLVFVLFYPLELFLHLISYGDLLDKIILEFFSYNISSFEYITPFYFFILYISVSLLSIVDKRAFLLLNILFVLFNIHLYL
ncbi:MAG: ComEC/Rec2 family competence protein [Halarcobacter sp.]